MEKTSADCIPWWGHYIEMGEGGWLSPLLVCIGLIATCLIIVKVSFHFLYTNGYKWISFENEAQTMIEPLYNQMSVEKKVE